MFYNVLLVGLVTSWKTKNVLMFCFWEKEERVFEIDFASEIIGWTGRNENIPLYFYYYRTLSLLLLLDTNCYNLIGIPSQVLVCVVTHCYENIMFFRYRTLTEHYEHCTEHYKVREFPNGSAFGSPRLRTLVSNVLGNSLINVYGGGGHDTTMS